jgi:hypothetical protein
VRERGALVNMVNKFDLDHDNQLIVFQARKKNLKTHSKRLYLLKKSIFF